MVHFVEIAMKCEKDVKNGCWHCKLCEKCEKFNSVKNELIKKGFYSFNKEALFWEVSDMDCFTVRALKNAFTNF